LKSLIKKNPYMSFFFFLSAIALWCVDKNTLFCAAAVPLSGYFWDIIKNWRCFCDEEVSMSFFFLGKKVLIFKISGSRKWNGEVWMWLYGVAIYKQKKKIYYNTNRI